MLVQPNNELNYPAVGFKRFPWATAHSRDRGPNAHTKLSGAVHPAFPAAKIECPRQPGLQFDSKQILGNISGARRMPLFEPLLDLAFEFRIRRIKMG